MKNKIITKKAAVLGGLCVLIVLLYVVLVTRVGSRFVAAMSGDVSIDEKTLYRVSDVVDGDTIRAVVDGREITVRMLGVNTPEVVDPRKPVECFGPEASAETKSILHGRNVRLVENPRRELKDKYGRYLLYVYRDDGLFMNESLLLGGFAREYTVGRPYSFQAQFRADEATAKAAEKGLWGKCQK